MSGYGIRFIGLEGIVTTGSGSDKLPVGAWLESYDPEAHDGRGYATWTMRPRLAMRFITLAAAMECYRTIPKNKPTREDGRPNRPLTAFTVECVELPD